MHILVDKTQTAWYILITVRNRAETQKRDTVMKTEKNITGETASSSTETIITDGATIIGQGNLPYLYTLRPLFTYRLPVR